MAAFLPYVIFSLPLPLPPVSAKKFFVFMTVTDWK